MKHRLHLFIMLIIVCITSMAGTYTIDNLPMPYRVNHTRHVTNPDHILSPETVARMDSLLERMEREKGVQTVVAVVERIEGGDCYDFSINLGNKLGVGNSQNTGLIILLSTQDRCYQILTGEGLEGTLPDAMCRRIENRMMVPHLKQGDWDAAMLNTVSAVCGIVLEDESLINPPGDNHATSHGIPWFFYLFVLFLFIVFPLSWWKNRKMNTCTKCGAHDLHRINSQVTLDRVNYIEHHTETYRCPKCGNITHREHDEPMDNGTGFGGFPPVVGPFHRGFGGGGSGFGGGFSGGSFGGGSFGGGGSGGRF